MTHLGLGVMLGILQGNETTVNIIRDSIGKLITAVEVKDNELVFSFDDNTRIGLFDDGQSCCGDRYMNTDDDLSRFANSTFVQAEIKSGPDQDREWDVCETQFLIVTTSRGQFTIVNYNEHNGYYGGFLIRARKITDV